MLPGVTREGLLISSRFPVKNTFINFPTTIDDTTSSSHRCLRDTLSEAPSYVYDGLHSSDPGGGWSYCWNGWTQQPLRSPLTAAPLGSVSLVPQNTSMSYGGSVNFGLSSSSIGGRRWGYESCSSRRFTLNPHAPEFVPRGDPSCSSGETASPCS